MSASKKLGNMLSTLNQLEHAKMLIMLLERFGYSESEIHKNMLYIVKNKMEAPADE